MMNTFVGTYLAFNKFVIYDYNINKKLSDYIQKIIIVSKKRKYFNG